MHFFLKYTKSTAKSCKNSYGAPMPTAHSNTGEAAWDISECVCWTTHATTQYIYTHVQPPLGNKSLVRIRASAGPALELCPVAPRREIPPGLRPVLFGASWHHPYSNRIRYGWTYADSNSNNYFFIGSDSDTNSVKMLQILIYITSPYYYTILNLRIWIWIGY